MKSFLIKNALYSLLLSLVIPVVATQTFLKDPGQSKICEGRLPSQVEPSMVDMLMRDCAGEIDRENFAKWYLPLLPISIFGFIGDSIIYARRRNKNNSI